MRLCLHLPIEIMCFYSDLEQVLVFKDVSWSMNYLSFLCDGVSVMQLQDISDKPASNQQVQLQACTSRQQNSLHSSHHYQRRPFEKQT